jgi:hypothetical protein
LKQRKSWFEERCSESLDKRKQAKLQWLQDPDSIHGDNLNSVRLEANMHFRNKKREYLKHKRNECATHRKNKNIRNMYTRINTFKEGFCEHSNEPSSSIKC